MTTLFLSYQGWIILGLFSSICVLIGYVNPIFLISSSEFIGGHPLVDSKKVCVQNALVEAVVRTTLLILGSISAIYRSGEVKFDFQHFPFFISILMWIYLLIFIGALIANRQVLLKIKRRL